MRRFLGLDNDNSNGGAKGLGYRYVRDPRADAFLMAPRLTAAPEPPPEWEWALGPTLDQGRQGSCVGHGWTHWRNAAPTQPTRPFDHQYAVTVYDWAQNHDEWTDTPPEEGTSVQAGAKAMVNEGALKEGYIWGKTIDDLVRWVGNHSPAVMGTLWTSGMNRVSSDGFIPSTGGTIDGGHCYLCYGYGLNPTGSLYLKFQNSWGEDYADRGRFYILANQFEMLLDRGQYSICAPLELAPEPVPPTPPTPPEYRKRVTPSGLAMRPSAYYGKRLEIYERRGGQDIKRWYADPA